MNFLDFHSHHVPAPYPVTQDGSTRWAAVTRRLANEDLLLDEAAQRRVVNIPTQLIARPVSHDEIQSMNDTLAKLVSRRPGRLYGLASVDAYDGERSGREAERAIRDLGLRGLFVDCARAERMIDAPEARPTLEAAAQFGVPVFLHPVAPEPLTAQMMPYGPVGMLFARGTANAASLIALLEGGVFEQLPGLRVVVTTLALGGIAIAAGLSPKNAALLRRHVFIDTNVAHPGVLRACVELLGASNVVAGTDWPINEVPPARIYEVMQQAGLSQEEQSAIAAGNALRLLGVAVKEPQC